MRPLRVFTVKPSLPPVLEPLYELGKNLMWSWDHDLLALFRRLEADLWEETRHNPIAMLGLIKQERFAELAADDSFRAAFFCQAHDAAYRVLSCPGQSHIKPPP